MAFSRDLLLRECHEVFVMQGVCMSPGSEGTFIVKVKSASPDAIRDFLNILNISNACLQHKFSLANVLHFAQKHNGITAPTHLIFMKTSAVGRVLIGCDRGQKKLLGTRSHVLHVTMREHSTVRLLGHIFHTLFNPIHEEASRIPRFQDFASRQPF